MRVKIEDPEIYQKETEKRNIQIVLIIQKVHFDISRWSLYNFLNNMICSQNIQNRDWVGITEIVVYIKSYKKKGKYKCMKHSIFLQLFPFIIQNHLNTFSLKHIICFCVQ